jgi:ankyrin repeat protein
MEVDPTGQDREVDPSIRNNLPLRTACTKGYTEIVRLLLNDPRVNPSAANNQALESAVEFGRVEIVRMLMDYGKSLL